MLQVDKTITGSAGVPAAFGNGIYINVTPKPPGCDVAHKGLMYYDGIGGNLVVCDGTCYQVLATSKGGQCAAQSCNPGAKICVGDVVAQCDANGWTATNVEVCKDPKKYCHKGACSDQKCVLVNQPKYKGSVVNMNTRSHGGGFHPFYQEYWYPQWDTATVYRYDAAYKAVGSFNSSQKSMMQVWGESDAGTWYSANWQQGTVTGHAGKNNVITWSFNTGKNAGGVAADDKQVYAMRDSSLTLWMLDKKTGKQINTLALLGGTMGSIQGSLVVWGDKIYRGNPAGDVWRYDLNTGKHDGVNFKVATNIHNMSFNGQEYCISANSSSVYCYDLFGSTCPK